MAQSWPGQFEDLVAGANSNPLESAHGEKRTFVFAKLGVHFFVVMIVVTVSEHGPDTNYIPV